MTPSGETTERVAYYLSKNMKNDKLTDFSSILEGWYKNSRRILPWREEPSPYHVWLSEIMLQQTRVEAVKKYYSRFLAYYPNITALANGDLDFIYKLWEGLGYYSRARNLFKAAKIVQEQYGGELPKKKEILLSLPGIGEYTSNAIMAIAFHEPYVAIDGNLIRVFARLFESPFSSKEERIKQEAHAFYLSHLQIDPSVFNQALMDLGELVCSPNGTPHCEVCPFHSKCLAHKNKRELDFPFAPKKVLKKECDMTLFIVRYRDSLLIKKRPEGGLLSSLYEVPNATSHLTREEVEKLFVSKGFYLLSISSLPNRKHIFTHKVWNMRAYLVEISDFKGDYLFVNEEELERSFSLPSAFQHYAQYFFKK